MLDASGTLRQKYSSTHRGRGRSVSEEKQKTDVEKQMESMDPALAKSFQRITEIIDQREEERAYQLALWPDKDIGSPNELSRSALFPAIHPKKRAGLQNHMIAAQGSYTIYYTGLQLDQSYFDVFQGVMHIGRGVREGNEVRFSAHRLLKLIGRSTGGKDHKWLYTAFQTLTATSVAIVKDGKRVFWGSLLPAGKADLETGQYVIQLSRDLAKLFERGFTRVEWEQRRQLLHKPLAQWLQLYYASHAKPLDVSVDFLREKSGSSTKTLRKFRQNLKTALDQIKDVGVITEWSIDPKTDLVHVVRIPSPSQLKHLNRPQD